MNEFAIHEWTTLIYYAYTTYSTVQSFRHILFLTYLPSILPTNQSQPPNQTQQPKESSQIQSSPRWSARRLPWHRLCLWRERVGPAGHRARLALQRGTGASGGAQRGWERPTVQDIYLGGWDWKKKLKPPKRSKKIKKHWHFNDQQFGPFFINILGHVLLILGLPRFESKKWPVGKHIVWRWTWRPLFQMDLSGCVFGDSENPKENINNSEFSDFSSKMNFNLWILELFQSKFESFQLSKELTVGQLQSHGLRFSPQGRLHAWGFDEFCQAQVHQTSGFGRFSVHHKDPDDKLIWWLVVSCAFNNFFQTNFGW